MDIKRRVQLVGGCLCFPEFRNLPASSKRRRDQRKCLQSVCLCVGTARTLTRWEQLCHPSELMARAKLSNSSNEMKHQLGPFV